MLPVFLMFPVFQAVPGVPSVGCMYLITSVPNVFPIFAISFSICHKRLASVTFFAQ